MTLNITNVHQLLIFISDPKSRNAARPTCEILSKVLLQLHRLVKDFIGLLVRLPLIHFPENDNELHQSRAYVSRLDCSAGEKLGLTLGLQWILV